MTAVRAAIGAETKVEHLTFERFFEGQYDRLVRALYLVGGMQADAEDIAQEALARVYERWDRVATMTAPEGYLFRIAMNLSRRRWRRLRLENQAERAGISARDPTEMADERSDVLRVLAALPSVDRQVLVLREWLRLETEEIAAVLKLSPGSVRVRLHRARNRFRAALGSDYG